MEENIASYTLDHFKESKEVCNLIDALVKNADSFIQQEADIERLTVIFDQYLEQPHLIDPYLEEYIDALIQLIKTSDLIPSAFHQSFKYLYLITKVRGFKRVIRYFPHEVNDLEYVLQLLNKQSLDKYENWETRYILLLWLAMVSIIPFDLTKLDGNKAERKPILDRIIESVQPYLKVADKCRDAAAYLIAKFITRPDVHCAKLGPFIESSCEKLKIIDKKTMRGINETYAILCALALIFKHGKREDLFQYGPKVLNCIEELDLLGLENSLIRKLAVKLAQRLGMVFLVPRLASWRYLRGSRSLADNLKGNVSIMSNESKFNEEESDDEFDIPEEIETVIELLITGLKDTDTIVRWSAAKGIGRITARLPKELADDVVESLLELFEFIQLDGAWHGGCLALAELGRRGFLLPERLKEVVPIILRGLVYDVRRGSYSVGSHVRDAACYVCWSFARAYEPEQIKPYIIDIATALLTTTVFDREVNCRRAASAAFQENVGRQGTFPHGIDIVTKADYFAVGNRKHCYTELSVYIGGFKEYCLPLIDHLLNVKISHWDSNIRELTASALASLTPLNPDYMENTVLPILVASISSIDMLTKHGAILAFAEVVHALHLIKGESLHLSESTKTSIKNLASNLRVTNKFKGFAGELMRKSVCILIERLSQCDFNVEEENVLDDWLFAIEDTIPHTEESVREFAISSLPCFCKTYVKNSKHFDKNIIVERFLSKLQSHIKFERMGYAHAIGALPRFMIDQRFSMVINSLIEATVVDKDSSKAGIFAESRQLAITSLANIVKTIGLENPEISNHIDKIYEAMFTCMNDYTMDSRGDVGTWVREAAMTSLVELTTFITKENCIQYVNEKRLYRIVCCLLQQCAEKIDRTRGCAGNLLSKLLYHKPDIPQITKWNELLNILESTRNIDFDWSTVRCVFPLLKEILEIKEYQYSLLVGYTVSVGGLTESLVRWSSDSLLQFLSAHQENEEELTSICNDFIKIFNTYSQDARVTIPLMKTLDLLLSSGCFEIFVDQNKCEGFPLQLLQSMKTEVKGSRDVKKLLASITVFCNLLQFPNPVKDACLNQLMLFLCHRYPRIRCVAAEQLYTTLITFDDLLEENTDNYDKILGHLTDVDWSENIENLRVVRNELCDWLKLPIPKVKKTTGNASKKSTVPVDDLDSYKDLVSREHGY